MNEFKTVLLYIAAIFTLINSAMLINITCKNYNPNQVIEEIEVVTDSIDLTCLELTPENFVYVCAVYDIQHPEIVYAQAKLESGHFSSKVYQTKNNFLGLYDSRKHDYYEFSHWSECLRGYKDYVQVKWDGNCDYYQFLQNLPYATDQNYIKKVKYLASRV